MSLPTFADLATLDYAWNGQPWCQLAPHNVDTNTLDVGWNGQPFSAQPAPDIDGRFPTTIQTAGQFSVLD